MTDIEQKQLLTKIITNHEDCSSCAGKDIAEEIFSRGFRIHTEGEWLDLPDNGNGWFQGGVQIYPKRCSICGDVYSKQYNFCPNCGAKMRVHQK